MGSNVDVTIDLTEAGLDLNPEDLEELTQNLADEMKELTEDIRMVRESEIPEGGKPALAGWIAGVLQAEISGKNIKAALDFLGNRFYGKTFKLEYEGNGNKCSIEYNNQEQLDAAISAIEKLSKLKISVTQADDSKSKD
jgi:hypothetical protein